MKERCFTLWLIIGKNNSYNGKSRLFTTLCCQQITWTSKVPLGTEKPNMIFSDAWDSQKLERHYKKWLSLCILPDLLDFRGQCCNLDSFQCPLSRSAAKVLMHHSSDNFLISHNTTQRHNALNVHAMGVIDVWKIKHLLEGSSRFLFAL